MPDKSDVVLGTILKEALDSSPNCFGIVNKENIVVYCNAPFAGIYGVNKTEVIGKNNDDLLRKVWCSKQGVKIESDDFDQWLKDLKKIHQELDMNQFETDLTDGRWFKMTRFALESGYMIVTGVEITELKQAQKHLEDAYLRIEALANTDQLTGVHNRRSFNQISDQEVQRAIRYQQPLSLLALDIDYFKDINDTYGHEGGDDTLREFADLCSGFLRQSDSLCRIGGEEFTVLLPMTDISGARTIAERIRAQVAAHPFYLTHSGQSIQITVSIGISSLTEADQSIKEVLVRADSALYTAKRNGRNQVAEKI